MKKMEMGAIGFPFIRSFYAMTSRISELDPLLTPFLKSSVNKDYLYNTSNLFKVKDKSYCKHLKPINNILKNVDLH